LEKDRKLQIIKAAEKRFVKHGLHKTTLDEIARDLRIGKSTIYHYFTSKEDLYFSTLRWQIEQYHIQLKNILFQEKDTIEKIKDYYNFKSAVFENYKLILPLFIHFMDETNFEEEISILKELYSGEENLMKEIFSKTNFRSENLNFNFAFYIVHQSWGILINNRITKTTESQNGSNLTGLQTEIFASLLK
jgi:AcrR family transcriptional regulator